ncbi:MAG: guanylate kinase [Planctomycetota bacterium]|jgi:guanylate kinase
MNDSAQSKGKIIVISGPSGVGKSTITSEVIRRLPELYLSISSTTRPKAENETDGLEYFFISREDFEQGIKDDNFLEHAEVFGNLYGTPKDRTMKKLDEGKTVILEIDVQGGTQVQRLYPDVNMIFIVPPSQKALAQRIQNRGRENSEQAETRLELADDEIASAWKNYNHIVINDDLEPAVAEVIQIIKDVQAN